ncbi:hypothetical protein LCGC14_2021230 [marine sediment metagenome]|uniref:Uncharacterized protein n=1 Tax=marine sediment metagenome TaxID=412755 RepID=A0A0F9FK11_9ZZZZ
MAESMRESDLRHGAVVMVTRDSPPGIERLRGYYGAMGVVTKAGGVNFGRGPGLHTCGRAEVSWMFHCRYLVLLEAAHSE